MDDVGFVVKKTFSAFVYPLGLSLLLIYGGLASRLVKPKSRWGGVLILSGALVLTIMSLPITAYLLMHSIEGQTGRQYGDPEELKKNGVRHIVVLGAEIVTSERTPADRFGPGLHRVMEGIRLWKSIPGSFLVLSGGAGPSGGSDKDAMAVLPIELGVPREALILENRAMDTEDEARLFAEIVGNKPFALVTSARHMSRAVRLFEMVGTKPIPCPCDFGSLTMPPLYSWFVPGTSSLSFSQKVVHNYLGEFWIAVKGLFRQGALKETESLMSPGGKHMRLAIQLS